MKQRIKSPGANSIAMLCEFFDQPKPVDRVLRCVMQDVELNEVSRKKIETGTLFGCFRFVSSRHGRFAHSSMSFQLFILSYGFALPRLASRREFFQMLNS